MPAPSNIDLLSFEKNFEDASAGYITNSIANTVSNVQVLTPRVPITVATELTTPRITVRFAVSNTPITENIGTTGIMAGSRYYAERVGSMEITCAVRRDIDGIDNLRGAVRVAMLEVTQAFNSTNLPYYKISFVRETGSSLATFEPNDEIMATIGYEITFAIKPDQWA